MLGTFFHVLFHHFYVEVSSNLLPVFKIFLLGCKSSLYILGTKHHPSDISVANIFALCAGILKSRRFSF